MGVETRISYYTPSTHSHKNRLSKVFDNSMNGMGRRQREQVAREAGSHVSQAQVEIGWRVSPGKYRGMFFPRNKPRKAGQVG